MRMGNVYRISGFIDTGKLNDENENLELVTTGNLPKLGIPLRLWKKRLTGQ